MRAWKEDVVETFIERGMGTGMLQIIQNKFADTSTLQTCRIECNSL